MATETDIQAILDNAYHSTAVTMVVGDLEQAADDFKTSHATDGRDAVATAITGAARMRRSQANTELDDFVRVGGAAGVSTTDVAAYFAIPTDVAADLLAQHATGDVFARIVAADDRWIAKEFTRAN